MLYYIFLELVLISFNITNLNVIIKKRNTKFLSLCNYWLLVFWLILEYIINYKSKQVGLQWELDNSNMIEICFYTRLITALIFIFYEITIIKMNKSKD